MALGAIIDKHVATGPARQSSGFRSLVSPEHQVLSALIDGGPSDSEIAERLGLSERTVQRRLAQAAGKLEVKTRVGLALRYFAEMGFRSQNFVAGNRHRPSTNE